MFRKLFFSFWLTVAIVAVALEAAALYLRRLEQESRVHSAALAASARSVADAYERGVPAPSVSAMNILDANGRSILGRAVSPAERKAATMAARIYASGFGDSFGGNGVVAVHFLATSGHPFSVIARARTTFIRSQWFALAALLVVGGVVCFVLARHFAAPLVQLGAAANAVADGRLDTRVGPGLTARRDEIGRLARDFDRMAERIESLVAAERRTLGDASHELRSPLARLNVALSLGDLARIEREAERLDKLIAELLTLARIDSGVEAKRERFDLAELVQEIVADGDFEARASGRRVELSATEPCIVDGAAELVRSAIENVVRNAIRHTEPGTAVDVALRCDGDRASLSVRDHGSGVDEASLAEIFKPFRRIDETFAGAGLGLAIAERVVRMHGGTIRASNAGGGMLVVIDLPLSDN